MTRRWVLGTVILLILLVSLYKAGWLEVHHAPTAVPLKVAYVRLEEVVQAHKAYSQLQALEQKEAQAKEWGEVQSIVWPALSFTKWEFKPQRDLSSLAKERIQSAAKESQFYAKQEELYEAARQRYAAQKQALEEQYRRPLADLHLKLDSVQATPEQKQKWQNDLDQLVQEKNSKLLQLATAEDQLIEREVSPSFHLPAAANPSQSIRYFTPISIPALAKETSLAAPDTTDKQALLKQIYGDIYSEAQALAEERGYEAILTEPQVLLQPFDATDDLIQRIKSL